MQLKDELDLVYKKVYEKIQLRFAGSIKPK